MWKPDLVVSDGAGYREIVDAIAKAIEDGELRAGDRLPPLRDLAWHLKCNPTTVNRAYREAQARRLVAGEVGRGTFVLGTSPEAGLFALRAKAGQLIDLAISRPVLPNGITSMVDAVEQVSSIYPNVGDGYPDAELEIRSLQAASNWLSFRDRRLTSLSVLPTSGAHAALVAALGFWCRTGDNLLVEDPTFPGIRSIARQLRLNLVSVDCDNEGLIPEALEIAAHSYKAAIVVAVPNLQNPTGVVMSNRRRAAIVDVIHSNRLMLIEDDVYGPLSGRPPLLGDLLAARSEVTADSADPGGSGMLISSLSKAVCPGLRFGMLAAPSGLMAKLAADPHTTSWFVSPLSLAVGTMWLNDGSALRATEWQRNEVAARYALAQRILDGLDLPTPSPMLWLPVQGEPDEVVARARAVGIGIVSGDAFTLKRHPQKHVRVCLSGAPDQETLAVALTRLRSVLESFR